MANCGICGGFTLSGSICALCSNSSTTTVYHINNSKEFSHEMERIEERSKASQKPSGGTLEANLIGELKNRVLEKNEKTWIDTVLNGGDGNLESIWNGRPAYHNTQPRSNFTVVYQRLGNSDINIIGLGCHTRGSNKKYSIDFDDGKKGKLCERT